jgi:2-oxoisovalerate dehydrogenase E2 component (dihydrolipoyl transacylase)
MPPTTTRDFVLPDLGEGLEDAVLVAWDVQVGDAVAINQPLCTVETAKATVSIPSPFEGTVVQLIGEPGATIAVGAVLVRVQHTASSDDSGRDPERQPTLVGYGPGVGPKRRRRRASLPPAPPVGSESSARALAKPPLRRMARDLGVDLAALAPGSGPDGVITRADVQRAADQARRGVSRPASPTKTPAITHAVVRAGTVIPVVGIRARIAERMTTSRSTIPEASCRVVVDCARLLTTRAAVRDLVTRRAGVDVLTPFSLILRAAVMALVDHPILNSTFDADAGVIRVHDGIHLGIGTDTSEGLVVTVVRDAHRRSLVDLATEAQRLTDAARDGTLAPTDLIGSTFTVSNFGSLGLDDGYPIINHPEAAILGVGAIRHQPAVVDRDVVSRPLANLTCSFDHRVCDGADVGAWLNRVRALIQAPEQLIIDA